MKRILIVTALVGCGALALLWMQGAQPAVAAPTMEVIPALTGLPQDHAFVGAKDGCRKCHLREYRSWEKTPHAEALATLEAEGAAENAECLGCHTTGYGTETGYNPASPNEQLAAVTCESCHGAGADYMDKDVMKDHDASVAAGLNIPTEQTCTSCHNADSPTFPGSFDFEAMKAEGVHDIRR